MFFEFKKHFWKNPVLSLEISRILCNASSYVLPQGILKVEEGAFDAINRKFDDFMEGKAEVDELMAEADRLEEKLNEQLNRNFGYLHELGLEPHAKVAFVSRILSRGFVYPDVQIFVGKRGCKKLRELSKVERRILEGRIELGKGREKLLRLEGKLLGYPDCCVGSYIESKRGFPAESRFIMECAEKGVFVKSLKALKSSKLISIPYLFTSNFYPCSIECSKAVKVGLKIQEWLDEFEDAFKLRSMLIALFYAATALRASKAAGNYGEKLRSFFSSLSPGDIGLIETLERHSGNQAEFTNLFIARILGGFSKG
jgi:hypothetical protein